MRGVVGVMLLVLAFGFTGTLAPAGARGESCDGTEPICFDLLPRDDTWERAIHLPAVPDWFEGDGVAVAAIDTGVVPNRDLDERLRARIDFTSRHDGMDRFGHGTHIAGLIAGDGSNSDRAYEGAAPETDLVSVKVAGWDGATDVTTVIAALQWVVSNRARYGIRVVNLSWGTDGVQPADVDPLDAAVERAWRAGIVVVVAAGNAGPDRVSKPGDDPHVITVGAADIAGTAYLDDDTVAEFSSRGLASGAGQKPDVLAPGVSLVSDRARGSTIDHFVPSARVGYNLFKGSGTSQAAAIVSGVVARMFDANLDLTPDQVKTALMRSTGGHLAGDAGGAGMIDAAAAVDFARHPETLPSLDGDAPPDSDGTGTLKGARGELFSIVRDLDNDGAAEPLAGEIDVLGAPWDAEAYMHTPWTAESWAQSPWAPLVAEIVPGTVTAPAVVGPVPPLVAWDAEYWGARSAVEAGWDARYWGARYWGARYWGTSEWR
jgi:serine protease AprX